MMEEQTPAKPSAQSRKTRVIIVTTLLLAGFLVMGVLARMKRRPSQVSVGEKTLRVEGYPVHSEDVPITLSAYGMARPLRTVTICAPVPGLITHVHAELQAGGFIEKGDVLFCIEDSDYRAGVAEATAAVEQNRRQIVRHNEELDRNRNRLKTVHRNRALAEREYERVRELLEKHEVGSQMELDMAEQALNTLKDRVAELETALALAPMLIKEAEILGMAAASRQERAIRQLERCQTQAEFRARVVRPTIEQGQFIHIGTPAVILADDSQIEIPVPLDAGLSQKWLQLRDGGEGRSNSAWFAHVEPVSCTVRWSETPASHQWTGTVHRIEQFNPETRTLMVVLRVSAEQATEGSGFPLVAGMFCSVGIPGRTATNVFRVPRWSISVDQTVYTAVDGRLKTKPVHVAHTYGDIALVDQGLEQGDMLIVTRLSDELENSLLDLQEVSVTEALQ